VRRSVSTSRTLIGAIEQAGHDLMFELNLIFAFSERYLAENETCADRPEAFNKAVLTFLLEGS
jgi:hypothetical protein